MYQLPVPRDGLAARTRAGRRPARTPSFAAPATATRAGLACRLALALALAAWPAARAWSQAISQEAAANQEALREQERARALREQFERQPEVRLPTGAGPSDGGRLRFDESPCFVIGHMVLEGEAAARFQWALAAAGVAQTGQPDNPLGHCLGARAIDQVLQRVQNAILARGYVTTRVLVAPQDLSGGTLKLTLIAGRVRAIRTLPGSGARATLWNAIPVAPGELLDLRAVEQGLENFKRVPTADADIQILPAEGAGAGPGDSDLAVLWRQGWPLRASLSLDDSGSAATGKYQAAMTISYDHPLALNDLFFISVNHALSHAQSSGQGATAHYSLPYGRWLLGATAAHNRYRQSVPGAFQAYTYSGESKNGDLKLARVVYRDAVSKSTVSLRGWARSSRNFIDDTEVAVQRRRMAGWEMGLEQRATIGPATLELHLNYRRGTGAWHAQRAVEEARGEGTSRFGLIATDATIGVPFTVAGQQLRYQGAWRSQHNRTTLIAQDRFAIGGRYTVRGFDGENSLVAERGWLLRNEIGVPLGASAQELYVGLDHGEVAGPSSANLVGKRLTGAVLGLRGQWRTLQFDGFAGAPVRKPPPFRTARRTAGFSINVNY
ncbi:ShlB/FhaC/HecB family hemolysin secretion/activation protein [Rugamonas apoptosis]|uniref:ShlB/FhaC/HecB family hemolysin secretion/activation protein n=1 Tax=Rugamonas apoptosis TaxID=2758570 RepID=A0A7W2FAK2_9BURK|nr:ShlB/FhaC/HecB family hemolysin secretion/activation protein [Rugamonas apoptosis]MBA5688165.1 ShlB/FhaC/HecB family hemolysin secretion/activation protein [Rugamonas apoptosis]